jgi:hypothetical protein
MHTKAFNHVFLPAVLEQHGKMGAGLLTLANALADMLVPHLRREFRFEFIRTIGAAAACGRADAISSAAARTRGR